MDYKCIREMLKDACMVLSVLIVTYIHLYCCIIYIPVALKKSLCYFETELQITLLIVDTHIFEGSPRKVWWLAKYKHDKLF